MDLIDTHAHLFWESYQNDLDQVIQRSLEAGITEVINVGVDVNLSKVAANLTSDKIKFYSTIGIHPHEAIKYLSDESIHIDIAILEEIYRLNPQKVIAVGECGLDYLFNKDYNGHNSYKDYREKQKKLFQAQIDLAKKLNLPLLVHCRDDRSRNPSSSEAWDENLEMIKNHYGILHCYSGLMATTKKAIDSNFLISFAGNITYPKNEYLKETVKMLPLEKIALETDCPFLAPQSIRGQRNEPSSVKEVAQTVAEIKGISVEDVAEQTTKNVEKILRLRSG
ncbi:TatD family hydrolase [Candidatus Daviesbacteria bacterium]|nr:TatD family hydrolase [Candidatus Daviesbacteria bacterium]